MPETTPLIKAALNLRVGVGFDVYDQTEVYWVHFTGSDVTNILRSYGLTDDKKVFYCGSGPSYQNLFRAMINELQMCKDSYQEMLEMYLRQIFIKLQRYFNNSIRIDNSRTAETIDMAIAYFNEHYSESISIEEYAEKNHVSTSWFIRNFKLYVGYTNAIYFAKTHLQCRSPALEYRI